MAAPASVEPGSTERLQFLDAVRGFALVLMIVNHTGRWWQDGVMGWPRYNLIYTSMAIGAPLFLFLVGFCLPLSYARRAAAGEARSDHGVAAKFLQRGARLILASWLLNFLVFRDEPFWEGGVLQTIGLGIMFGFPPMRWLHRRWARALLLAVAIGLSGGHMLKVIHNYFHALRYWHRNHQLFGPDPDDRHGRGRQQDHVHARWHVASLQDPISRSRHRIGDKLGHRL